MLQYLLNATAIWLISLIVFDVFLRRESYHGYNRFYLAGTFIAGILFPLWEWPDNSVIYAAAIRQPVERVRDVKLNMVSGATPAATLNWQQWLVILYFAGVLITLCLFILDIIKLVVYYRTGKITCDTYWTIIETGKEHAPFSLFRLLFVNNRRQYSDDEWTMICAHEQRHTSLLHITDLLLMQAGRIIFWFHPLVYIYNKRLLMVHEYQADLASQQHTQYGRFLVEQAMLHSAPSLSHSFNRSPIKNRLVMLTRTSSPVSKVKMLLFIPVAAVCLICFSQNSFSQGFVKNGNMVTYKGNKFELSEIKRDTIVMLDPVDGKEIVKVISRDPYPVKINGEKIYMSYDIPDPSNVKLGDPASYKSEFDGMALKVYLLSNMKEEFNNLADGEYYIRINSVVLDEQGKIVYYENGGISLSNDNDPRSLKIPPAVQERILKKIHKLLNNAPKHRAALFNGDYVPYLIDGSFSSFTIKDHKVVAE